MTNIAAQPLDYVAPLKTYLFSYPYHGSQWSFELRAKSPEDAVARLSAIPRAEYIDELPRRRGWLTRLAESLSFGDPA